MTSAKFMQGFLVWNKLAIWYVLCCILFTFIAAIQQDTESCVGSVINKALLQLHFGNLYQEIYTYRVAAGCVMRHFSTTCAVNSEGWWLSSCHSSVAEHCISQASWVWWLVTTSLFAIFHLISNIYKSLYFQHVARIYNHHVLGLVAVIYSKQKAAAMCTAPRAETCHLSLSHVFC